MVRSASTAARSRSSAPVRSAPSPDRAAADRPSARARSRRPWRASGWTRGKRRPPRCPSAAGPSRRRAPRGSRACRGFPPPGGRARGAGVLGGTGEHREIAPTGTGREGRGRAVGWRSPVACCDGARAMESVIRDRRRRAPRGRDSDAGGRPPRHRGAVPPPPAPRRIKDHPLLWAIRNDLASTRGFVVLGVQLPRGDGLRWHLRRRARGAPRRGRGDRVSGPEVPEALPTCSSAGRSARTSRPCGDRRPPGRRACSGRAADRAGRSSLPPLPDATDLRALRRPSLLLAGEHDPYAPPAALRAYAALFPDAEAHVVEGTDHFFWRREGDAAEIVGDFAERALTPA